MNVREMKSREILKMLAELGETPPGGFTEEDLADIMSASRRKIDKAFIAAQKELKQHKKKRGEEVRQQP